MSLSMLETFEEQGELIWLYIGTLLRSAEIDYQHIISNRTYLADPTYDQANVKLRIKYLGNNRPSLTVIVCQLPEEKWELEVEVMTAK